MGAERPSDGTGAGGNAPDGIRAALAHLYEAHEYARETGRDAWDFAVEIHVLAALGASANVFRWLVCKGYADHAREITLDGDPGRSFRPEGGLSFGKRTCFVLTEEGVAYARSALKQAAAPDAAASPARSRNGTGDPVLDGRAGALIPHWDAGLRELRLGDHVVKRFRRLSPNQERILAVFEEEGWPPRIDDPLPRHPDGESKRRLHDTIKGLNHKQQQPLIHFLGDGTGEGVSWALTAAAREERI